MGPSWRRWRVSNSFVMGCHCELSRWDITFHWISFQCNSLRFPDITSHCHIKLCYIITDCVYLYFVLLSELEHFGLLSQYYRPLGSWSIVSTQRFSEKTDTIKTKICWRNQKVKTIIRMCCIIPRGMEVWIPMPHKIQNKKNHHLAQPGFPCLLLPLWTALLITI